MVRLWFERSRDLRFIDHQVFKPGYFVRADEDNPVDSYQKGVYYFAGYSLSGYHEELDSLLHKCGAPVFDRLSKEERERRMDVITELRGLITEEFRDSIRILEVDSNWYSYSLVWKRVDLRCVVLYLGDGQVTLFNFLNGPVGQNSLRTFTERRLPLFAIEDILEIRAVE